MTKRVLVIGGYGNFGSHITKRLAIEENIQLIVAGRNLHKADEYVKTIHCNLKPETASLDSHCHLEKSLAEIAPDIVIHTSGPYQSQDYHVAKACINQGCHYIDLADARRFVCGIESLDSKAKSKGVLICSGASSVPCLTSAVIDQYKPQFNSLKKVEFGIATAQLTNRGLATTSAVLSYAGKPFKTLIDGRMQDVYGWHNLKRRKFWGLNRRFLGNCDIPDLEIFTRRYPALETIRFEAGIEPKVLHIGLWFLSWLVRLRLFPSLQRFAPHLLKLSRVFDGFGKDDSGFYMHLYGSDDRGGAKELEFNLVARHGDGLYIPVMPAILMAKKLVNGELTLSGATPCVGYVTLDEYLGALSEFDISWQSI